MAPRAGRGLQTSPQHHLWQPETWGCKKYDLTEEAEAHRNPDAQDSSCGVQNPKAGDRGYMINLAVQETMVTVVP